MASIGPVTLTIIQSDAGETAVKVAYTIRGTQADVDHSLVYDERVELFGVDRRPGEDGIDDRIPSAFGVALVEFGSTSPRSRVRTTTLPSVLFDEDRGITLEADEIQARVTLTRHVPTTSAQLSNVVVLHKIVIGPTA